MNLNPLTWFKKAPRDDRAKAERVTNADGLWFNPATRYGIPGKDKTMSGDFLFTPIDQETGIEVWRGDDLGGRIVELIPQEMTREGWQVVIEGDDEGSEAVNAAGRERGVEFLAQQGLCYGRACGGGGALALAQDGVRDLTVPLREDRISHFDGCNLLTPRELLPIRWYGDPTKPRYGDVAVYRMIPLGAPPGTDMNNLPTIHESRIIRFDGIRSTPRARFLNTIQIGWDDSIFTRIFKVLMDFHAAMQGVNLLAQDFAPSVFKALKLAELLAASKQTTSRGLNLSDRLSSMEFGSSNAKVKVIDTQESYERKSVSVAGLAELIELHMLHLSGSAGTPVSLLFGQAPSGLNATGDNEIRQFYDHVAADRRKKLYPQLRRFYTILMLSKDGPTKGKVPKNWDIVFPPLWQPTQAEIAKARLDVATADNFYINNGTLQPQQAAQRFAGDTFNMEIRIDPEDMQKLMEEQAKAEAAAEVARREADPEGPLAQAAQAGANKLSAEDLPDADKDAGSAAGSKQTESSTSAQKDDPPSNGQQKPSKGGK